MSGSLERDIRFLKIYAAASTILVGGLVLTGFRAQTEKPRFEEIDVERINVVEKDGRLRMVISNEARQHPGITNGKLISRTQPRPPGIIFFDHRGDEMGGLIFGDNGGKGHFGSLTWDKVQSDQVIRFGHLESDNGNSQTGIEIWQRPDMPGDVVNERYAETMRIADTAARRIRLLAQIDSGLFGAGRLFLGKRRDNATALTMSDQHGKTRLRLQVLPDGTPRLEFVDTAGTVFYSLPDSARR